MLVAFNFSCAPNDKGTPETLELKLDMHRMDIKIKKIEQKLDSIERGKFPFNKYCMSCPVTQ
jgi:hypothetical protein